MDNSIQIFNFENNSIRTIEIDNTIWFIAEDITTILEYDRVSNALRVVEDDDKLLITNKNSFSEFEKINIPDRGIFKSNGVPYERYIDNEFYIVENSSKSNKVYITRKGSDHLFWFLKSKKIIGEING